MGFTRLWKVQKKMGKNPRSRHSWFRRTSECELQRMWLFHEYNVDRNVCNPTEKGAGLPDVRDLPAHLAPSLWPQWSRRRQIATRAASSVAVCRLPFSLKHRAHSQISSTYSKLSFVARRSGAVSPFCFRNFKLYKVALVFMRPTWSSEWTPYYVKFITLEFHKRCPENSFINPLQTKRRPLYLKIQSVPRCKHFSSRL